MLKLQVSTTLYSYKTANHQFIVRVCQAATTLHCVPHYRASRHTLNAHCITWSGGGGWGLVSVANRQRVNKQCHPIQRVDMSMYSHTTLQAPMGQYRPSHPTTEIGQRGGNKGEVCVCVWVGTGACA